MYGSFFCLFLLSIASADGIFWRFEGGGISRCFFVGGRLGVRHRACDVLFLKVLESLLSGIILHGDKCVDDGLETGFETDVWG